MRAIFQTGYGSPDNFELSEVDKPAIKEDQVLVNVHAAALHAGDVFYMRGVPYMVRLDAGFPRPKKYIPGFDLAGVVEAAGKKVTRFKPGDQVFGAGRNTCAEYAAVKEVFLVLKPDGLSFEEAAAVPTSGLAALQGLRDAGKVQAGQKVLINGATGGVGHFAVQIANILGAEVTGVCSSGKVDLVRSLGAGKVIDYTKEDFAAGDHEYDLILDQVASRTLADYRRALKPTGVYIPNSGHSGLPFILKAAFLSGFLRQIKAPFGSTVKEKDLKTLKEMLESGKLKPVIDKSYPLADTAEAFRYLNTGHARGKVVITVNKK